VKSISGVGVLVGGMEEHGFRSSLVVVQVMREFVLLVGGGAADEKPRHIRNTRARGFFFDA